MRKVIGVLRAQEYSPGAVERDEAIMRAVVEPLYGQLIMEENVTETTDFADCIVFSMARRPEILQVLSRWESLGVRVINPTAGVMNCRRSIVEHIMRKHHLPCPPSRGQYGYWLKRGDMAVTVDNGIAYCRNEKELEGAKSDFAERGITDIVVQAHVRGDVVKFYGVEPKGFFRVYHVDDNESHYFYQKQVLQANAELLARLVGVQVYGGDAVITADGDAYIVDFNDWPSFSRCLCEAAEAIVKMVR